MHLIKHQHEYGKSLGSTHRLYFLGDVHLGAKLCHRKAFEADLAEIESQDPRTTHLFLMGDMGDYINRADWRFDEEAIDPEIINLYSGVDPNEQTLDALTQYLEPVKPYIRVILRGNHGEKDKASGLWTRYDRKLADRHYLDMPHLYGGYSALVRQTFVWKGTTGAKRSILTHVHHGWQAGRKSGNKVNQMDIERKDFRSCDLLMRGHSHDLFWHQFPGIEPNQQMTDLKSYYVGCGHTGTYLRTFDVGTESYSEKAGYSPTNIGCLRVEVTMTHDGFEFEGRS
jgi:UDP-2,3-diacylglucosamine pyrophosphatase LpxH